MSKQTFDAVSLGIMWDRLVALVDEIVSTLVRTSFSTIVNESYDLTCVLLDEEANSIAQGTFSVPVFIGSAPVTLRHMLKRYPPKTLQPGDVIITNDPWMGTGHLYDITMVRPVFRKGRIVAYERLLLPFSASQGVTHVIASLKTISEDGSFEIRNLMRGSDVLPMPILRAVIDRELFHRAPGRIPSADLIEFN